MRNRRTSASDSKGYPEFCLLAAKDDRVFNLFRSQSSSAYGRVLEHFSYADGKIHLEELERRNPELVTSLSRCSANEITGCPELHDYNPHGRLAPSTIRYTRHLGDLLEKFGPLDNLNLIEIGGGYGGLCKVTFDSQRPRTYTLVDLPEALLLAERFLRATLSPENLARVRFVDGTELAEPIHCDLVISNCAFSECLPSVQDTYMDNILAHAKSGSLLINLRRESHPPTVIWRALADHHPDLLASSERPSTNPTNFMLNWGVNPTFMADAIDFPWKSHLKLNAFLGDALYGTLYRLLFRIKLRKRVAAVARLFERQRP